MHPTAFSPVPTPARLWVPCAARPPFLGVWARAAGTAVARGEPLTESGAEAEHTPLAPVAGRIAGAGRVVLTNGREVPAVVLDTTPADGTTGDSPDEDSAPPTGGRVGEALSAVAAGDVAAWIDRLRRAGVWADRWTSPDLLGQLHQCLRRPADTVVCSLLDADPGHGVNGATAEAYGAELVAGVAALARLARAERVWAVADAAGPADAFPALRQTAADAATELRIVPLENDYPQADPTLLLYTLLRRRLRPGRLPTEQGVLLLDAAAAVAVGRVVLAGGPMLRVPVAVFDPVGGRTHFLSVPVGTAVRDVLAAAGVTRPGLDLRGGGLLRDVRLTPAAVVAGGELGLFAGPRLPDVNPDPCLRCGWCLEGCPVRIHPPGLLEAAQRGDVAMAHGYGLDACIECGICTYVCPSRLPLLAGIRQLRAEKVGPPR